MDFLGLERPVEYTGYSIFDPTTAKMVLDAQDKYFAAVYADYLQGLEDMKEFRKEYDDFITPILADLEWYNNNVTGKVRGFINDAYARGIDLTRSLEGRAALSLIINSVDVGKIAKLRSSSENAKEFLKARKALEAQGLYNPLLAKYDAPDMSTYSTLDLGIWDKTSPTPYQNMADFSKAYFDNIQPFERSATKNGINYTVSEINMDDLHRIADAHFNDLVNTSQGRLMYLMYKDQLGSDEAARAAFNDAVVSGNLDRLRYADNYDDMNYKMQNLNLKQQSLAIQRENLKLKRDIAAAKARGDNGGNGTQLNGVSLAQAWYDTAMAKAYSADGIIKDWWDMNKNYDQFGQQAEKIFHDFGSKQKSISPVNDADLKSYVLKYGSASDKQLVNIWANPGLNGRTKDLTDRYNALKRKYTSKINGPKTANEVQEEYRKLFSISMDGESVAKIVGTPMSDSKTVGKIKPGYIDRLYSTDDIISNTSGYRFTHTSNTNKIRQAIKNYGASNTTITALEEGYGSLRKNTGSFEVMPRVRVTCTDNEGNIVFQSDAYVDIDLGSYKTKGGSYIGDYKTSGGVQQYGSMTNPANAPKLGRYDINGLYNPGYRGPVSLGESTRGFVIEPEKGGTERNFYPDYNRWTGYGTWDTDVTHSRLHVPYSGLATLPTIPEDSGYDLIFDDDYDEE